MSLYYSYFVGQKAWVIQAMGRSQGGRLWVQEIEPDSCGVVADALNCGAISPVLAASFKTAFSFLEMDLSSDSEIGEDE